MGEVPKKIIIELLEDGGIGCSQNVNELLLEVDEKPFAWIYPSTAEHLGIKDGNLVKIITPRAPKTL